MKTFISIKPISLIVILIIAVSCSDQFTEPAPVTGDSVFKLIANNENLDIMEAALLKTNLSKSLDNLNSGTFTVFTPHDSAFLVFFKTLAITNVANFKEADVVNYIKNEMNTTSVLSTATLAARLNYHQVTSKIATSNITNGNAFATLNGARLSASHAGSYYYLNANTTGNGSKIVTPDISASNGTIHIVNKVLTAVGTASILGGFAPAVTVSYATNPPTYSGGGDETGANAGDTNGSDYDILAYALRRTGLASTLLPNQSPLPDFTLFAPTDNAFRSYFGDNTGVTKAQEDAAIQLVKAMDITVLTDLIKYHIVTGRLLTTDFTDGQSLTTLNTGKSITLHKSGTITLTDLNVTSADATISSTNLLTNAGVYHQISAVLQPQ